MTLKTILVHLNHEERLSELIAVATAIARQAEAHVIGLYVMPPLFTPSDLIVPMGPEIFEQQVAAHETQAARTKTVFERLTTGEPFVAEWRVHGDARSAYDDIAVGVIAEARAAELVIVSQATGDKDPLVLVEVAERVALESGRPVLVVPVAWSPRAFGTKVAIAWNDSREAARAAFDALPLLRAAKQVQIISIAETIDGTDRPEIPAAEIAATLARHGLNIDVKTIPSDGRHAGNTLLSCVAKEGADLLVMGAYGHSRLREFILGGATRDVLKNMTVPILLSH